MTEQEYDPDDVSPEDIDVQQLDISAAGPDDTQTTAAIDQYIEDGQVVTEVTADQNAPAFGLEAEQTVTETEPLENVG